jgi:hypothetical protein
MFPQHSLYTHHNSETATHALLWPAVVGSHSDLNATPLTGQHTFRPEELESLQGGLPGEFATSAQKLASDAKDQEPHDEATAGSDGCGKISVRVGRSTADKIKHPSSESRYGGAKGIWAPCTGGGTEHEDLMEIQVNFPQASLHR